MNLTQKKSKLNLRYTNFKILAVDTNVQDMEFLQILLVQISARYSWSGKLNCIYPKNKQTNNHHQQQQQKHPQIKLFLFLSVAKGLGNIFCLITSTWISKAPLFLLTFSLWLYIASLLILCKFPLSFLSVFYQTDQWAWSISHWKPSRSHWRL